MLLKILSPLKLFFFFAFDILVFDGLGSTGGGGGCGGVGNGGVSPESSSSPMLLDFKMEGSGTLGGLFSLKRFKKRSVSAYVYRSACTFVELYYLWVQHYEALATPSIHSEHGLAQLQYYHQSESLQHHLTFVKEFYQPIQIYT